MSDIEMHLRDILPRLSRVGAAVRFDLGGDGCWVVDARGSHPTLTANDDDDVDVACSIALSADNLIKLIEGRMDPMLGYALGKLKVTGSVGVAMKLVNAIA